MPQNRGAPHEYPSGHTAARGLHRPVQHSQPLLTAAIQRERPSEGSLHVGLTLGPSRYAGQPQPLPQLRYRCRKVSLIAENDPDRW